MKRALLFSVLMCIACVSMAEELSLRVWLNDSELFHAKVMEPLKARLQAQPCKEDMGLYLGEYFNSLSEIRASVHEKSFLLFREMGLAAGEEIGPFEVKINCSVAERWDFMSHIIEKKIEFIANVLSLLK